MSDVATLVLWEDNGNREYEWLMSDSGMLSLDFSNKANNLKIFIANNENAKLELDMKLMLWIGVR